MKVINFIYRYEIQEPIDNYWGSQLANGTWVGMTGMLHRKEVDVAIGAMSLTAERAFVTDYTTPIYHDHVVLVTRSPPEQVHRHRFFLMEPFHWLVYILLASGLIYVTLFLKMLSKFQHQFPCKRINRKQGCETKKTKFQWKDCRSVSACRGFCRLADRENFTQDRLFKPKEAFFMLFAMLVSRRECFWSLSIHSHVSSV